MQYDLLSGDYRTIYEQEVLHILPKMVGDAKGRCGTNVCRSFSSFDDAIDD